MPSEADDGVGGWCSGREIWLFSESALIGGWDSTLGTIRENDGNPLDKRHLAIEVKTTRRYVMLGSRKQPKEPFVCLHFGSQHREQRTKVELQGIEEQKQHLTDKLN